jgi:hypothetical protein
LPLIASLTALKGRQRSAGVDWSVFDVHLSKPLELAELENLLATAVSPAARISGR